MSTEQLLLSLEVRNSHSLFSLLRTIVCFRIQEDLVMHDEVDGNGEDERGLFTLQAVSLGAQECTV